MIGLLATPAGLSNAQEDRPRTSHVDESLVRDAYGVLSTERLMYPVDMADWPLKITSERQLFVDDFLLASAKGLTRQLH